MQPFSPIVPPKRAIRWEYEAFRRISAALMVHSEALAAVGRGESPDGSGGPILNLNDYFYKPGLFGGQDGYGGAGASENLMFSSTKSSSKGFIYLGSARSTAFDETNNRLGIGTPSPEAKLHVLGTPSTGLVQASDDITLDIMAAVGYTEGWQCIQTFDGTSYLTANFLVRTGPNTAQFVTDTNPAASSFTINYVAYRTGVLAASTTVQYTVFGSDGIGYRSAAIVPNSVWTTSPASYSIVCNNAAGSGTPNTMWVAITNTGIDPGGAVVWDYIAIDTGGAESALTIVERAASSSVSYSIWRDESGITVASITNTGAGKFQNLILEDPGVGTNTITIKTPTSPTTHTLTLPPVPIDTGILQTDASGVTAWALPSSLRTRVQHRWAANGPFRVDTDVDGAWVPATAINITAIKFWRRRAGTSGQTRVDINKNGTTLYTTQANRPTILASAGNNAITAATLPDIVAVAAGDRITIDTDEIEVGSPRDYTLLIEGA